MMSSQRDETPAQDAKSSTASKGSDDGSLPNAEMVDAADANPEALESGVVESQRDSATPGTKLTFDSPELTEGLERYDAAIESALSQWRDEIDGSVLQPLWTTISASRSAAAELLKDFEVSDHSTPDTCRAELIRYRTNGGRQILVPLLGYLTASPPSRDATSVIVDTLSRIEDAASELPVVAEILDQAGGFEPDASDKLLMRLKKWNYRRRIRGGGNQLRRQVNARSLATYNSVIRIPQFLGPPNEALQQELGRVLAAVETAVAEWAAATIAIERPLSAFVRERVDAEILVDIRLAHAIKLDQAAAAAAVQSSAKPSVTERNGKAAANSRPKESIAESTGQISDPVVGDDESEAPDARAGNADSLDEPPPPSAEPTDAAADAMAAAVLAVRSQTEDLIAAFDQILTTVPEAELPARELTNGARHALREDLYRAGTPFLSIDQRTIHQESSATTRAQALERTWLEWNGQVVDRFDLYATLFELRKRMLDEERSILNRVARHGIRPVEKTFAGIKTMLAESAASAKLAAADARKANDLTGLLDSIGQLKSDNERFFSRTLRELPGMVSADKILTDPGSESWQRIQNFVNSTPEALTLHELHLDIQRPVTPSEATRTIELRARLNEAIQPVTQRLKASGEPLRRVLQRIWTDIEKAKTVVNYNLDTAISELTRITTGNKSGDDEDLVVDDSSSKLDVGIERTNELVVRGYERAATTLDDLLPAILEPWNAFSESVVDEIQNQWKIVLRKARTGDPDDPDWDGFAAMARRNWLLFSTTAREFGIRAGQRTKARFVSIRRGAKRIIQIGQKAVGAIEASDEDLSDSLDEIDRVAEIRRNLPLVYRYLFSFDPLLEPTLFEGRKNDAVWLRAQVKRWLDGEDSAAIILSAPIGSGRTTILNMISGSLLADHPHTFVTPPGRLTESELVHLFADALNVPIDESRATIAGLESAIIKGMPAEKQFVCLIDDLEHLFLKSVGGTILIERFLLLMSRTDMRIQWIATIGDLAWRYLNAAVGPSSSYPIHRALNSISRTSLESIVMGRHNRSAIPISFKISQAQSDAMKRWLSRTRSDEEKQQFARSQFFDRLYRQSGQNLALALFMWIRSASFSADSDLVEMQPLEFLKFEALAQQTLQQSFSIEAFLFHKTLSMKEHNEVLRLGETEGTMAIEALVNARLLTRVRSGDLEREEVLSDQMLPSDRFRIRPLLINPIRGMLSQRHVVY